MRRIAVIDAETDPFRKGRIPAPFLWGFYDGREYREYEHKAPLVEYLREHDFIVYAHNGGKFDFHFLLDDLEAYDNIEIINGRIGKMYIGKSELRDSWLIIPEKLAAYQKDEIDYALFESDKRDNPATRKLISAYLQSDCLYLHQMVSAFIEKFGLHFTVPGAAMSQWKKIEKAEELIPIDETDMEFYNRFAPYYYGGRVECFESGIIDANFAVYDINSAYPYAMLQMHPSSGDYHETDGYVSGADFYRLECVSGGALPYRGEGADGYGLTFPRDGERREYFITSWEYRAAIETKSIRSVKVIESITFARHTTFQAYIQKFWAERQIAKASGDILGSLFAKRLMNALYGKFASNPQNYSNYIIVPENEAFALVQPGAVYTMGGMIGPWALAEKPLDECEQRYYNVATGASITGFVRAMLWKAIHSSKRVLYVDTDSIACCAPGSIRLGDQLGNWKLEGNFDRAGIGGKKLYIFRGAKGEKNADGSHLYKTASKGARLTHAELWRVARGLTVEYFPDVPSFSVHKAPGFVNRSIRKTV